MKQLGLTIHQRATIIFVVLFLLFIFIAIISLPDSIIGFSINKIWAFFGYFIANHVLACILVWHLLVIRHDYHYISLWLFFFLITPIITNIFYAFTAFTFPKKKCNEIERIKNIYRSHELIKYQIIDKHHIKECNDAFKYMYGATKAPIYDKNNIKLLSNPSIQIKEIINIIQEAKNFIFLEYYILIKEMVFNYLLKLLKEKVKQGVKVNIIIDHWGTYLKMPKSFLKEMHKSGIEIGIFNYFWKTPIYMWQYRCHKKLIVVDNKYAIFGSGNLADENFEISIKNMISIELSILLQGPIVNSFSLSFIYDWNNYCYRFKNPKINFIQQKEKYLPAPVIVKNNNYVIAQLFEWVPELNKNNEIGTLLQLIYSAQESIIISTPYFSPPAELINALKASALKGVKVILLLPHHSEFSLILRTFNRKCLFELLTTKIKIYEYFGFLHQKFMIIDKEIVNMGTTNWDFRSFYLNYESSLQIKDKNLANNLLLLTKEQIQNSNLITVKKLKNKICWRQKWYKRIVDLVYPIL